MKLMKRFSLVAIVFALLLTLASCGISERYANKINDKAADGDHITYEKVVKKLGEKNIVDLTVNDPIFGSGHSGVVIAVKGCDSWEDVQAKLDAGKTVKGIVITFLGDKAQSAEYRAITADDNR